MVLLFPVKMLKNPEKDPYILFNFRYRSFNTEQARTQ